MSVTRALNGSVKNSLRSPKARSKKAGTKYPYSYALPIKPAADTATLLPAQIRFEAAGHCVEAESGCYEGLMWPSSTVVLRAANAKNVVRTHEGGGSYKALQESFK